MQSLSSGLRRWMRSELQKTAQEAIDHAQRVGKILQGIVHMGPDQAVQTVGS